MVSVIIPPTSEYFHPECYNLHIYSYGHSYVNSVGRVNRYDIYFPENVTVPANGFLDVDLKFKVNLSCPFIGPVDGLTLRSSKAIESTPLILASSGSFCYGEYLAPSAYAGLRNLSNTDYNITIGDSFLHLSAKGYHPMCIFNVLEKQNCFCSKV